MNHKDFNTYTDERIMNIIKQNYMYDDDHVKQASKVALERALIDDEALKRLLIEGSQKKTARREENFRNLQNTILSRSDQANSRSHTSLLISLGLLAAGLIVFLLTGWIFFIVMGAGAAGANSFGRGMFRR